MLHQLIFRIQTKAFWQKPKPLPNESELCCSWPEALSLSEPSGTDACQSIEPVTFSFIGLKHCFGDSIDWSGAGLGKLWDYNLHYFEWLWGLSPEDAKCMTLDWIDRHPFALNAVGWEPYPNALRIMNWLGYWGTIGRKTLNDDPDFKAKLFESIYLQCDWLTRRLEKHLLGNHYLENGAALLIAGTFFNHSATEKWKRIGQKILEEQLPEQMLADGMHFERSPMYHNRLVYLLSWLASIEPDPFQKWYQQANVAAAKLQHPDGKIALFNDSAFGIYPEVSVVQEVGPFSLPAAGYYGARCKSGDYIICDAGRIGPDYIPGHAHCDIGSFELSIGGVRFITDTGVHTYERNSVRHYTRSTAAHNTFAPDGMEQAEIWSAFRVGARPNVRITEWHAHSPEGFTLRVTHDGFSKCGVSNVSYERYICFSGNKSMQIEDHFTGPASWDWSGRLHFAPEVKLLAQTNRFVQLAHQNQIVEVSLMGVSNLSIKNSAYYPCFNQMEERLYLEYYATGASCVALLGIEWFTAKDKPIK